MAPWVSTAHPASAEFPLDMHGQPTWPRWVSHTSLLGNERGWEVGLRTLWPLFIHPHMENAIVSSAAFLRTTRRKAFRVSPMLGIRGRLGLSLLPH